MTESAPHSPIMRTTIFTNRLMLIILVMQQSVCDGFREGPCPPDRPSDNAR